MPTRFFNFMAVNVPTFDSDLRIPLDVRLMVDGMAPPPLLDESEPTLPLRILLRSSNGTSSGGEKPDLYRSITNRESYRYKQKVHLKIQMLLNESRYLFRVDVVSCSNNTVQTFVNDGKHTTFYIDALSYEILNLFDPFVIQFL